MASIINPSNHIKHTLRRYHVVGRDGAKADTRLDDRTASRVHGIFEWTGKDWQIRDHSRNGIWLNGTKVRACEPVPLSTNDNLQFGSPDSSIWQLRDASRPRSLLLGMHGESDMPLENYQFLPDDKAPHWVIFYSRTHHTWVYSGLLDTNVSVQERPLEHGQTIACLGRSWRFFMAEPGQSTELFPPVEKQLSEFEFLFDLSLDEESTQLRLCHAEEVLDLGERSHHYLLLHLARLRAEQARAGIDYKSQGWIDNDTLARDLGIELSHVNILIHRARKQIAERLWPRIEPDQLVERRKGRMRIGVTNFKIFKGETLTDELPVQGLNAS
ncbi:MAG: FHA domain-containing protein [Pseudomonadota bacterium]